MPGAGGASVVIVGWITIMVGAAKRLSAQAAGCPDVAVSISGPPVSAAQVGTNMRE